MGLTGAYGSTNMIHIISWSTIWTADRVRVVAAEEDPLRWPLKIQPLRPRSTVEQLHEHICYHGNAVKPTIHVRV